jgi:hypothetical protein
MDKKEIIEMKVVNIRLRRELWRNVKMKAVSESKTIAQLVTDALEKEIGGKNG